MFPLVSMNPHLPSLPPIFTRAKPLGLVSAGANPSGPVSEHEASRVEHIRPYSMGRMVIYPVWVLGFRKDICLKLAYRSGVSNSIGLPVVQSNSLHRTWTEPTAYLGI